MVLYLVHHGPATDPVTDFRQPLSPAGLAAVDRLAAAAAARGARPAAIWHSGKLRGKQTAELLWRACNPLATCAAIRGLQPGDPVEWVMERLVGEARDVMMVGHWPHLPRLLAMLLGRTDVEFPRHGFVALTRSEDGKGWLESWRLTPGDDC
jgi:phosphohistidine phosphatase